jgi:hypothetical protein
MAMNPLRGRRLVDARYDYSAVYISRKLANLPERSLPRLRFNVLRQPSLHNNLKANGREPIVPCRGPLPIKKRPTLFVHHRAYGSVME